MMTWCAKIAALATRCLFSKSKTTCFTINNAMLTGEKCHVYIVKQVVLLLEIPSLLFEETFITV